MNILTALLVIALIILVHELGHFLAAKREGIQVEEFSIGFGTRLYSFKKGETQYSLRLLPLGGYIRMAGTGQEEEEPNPRGFNQKTPWQKIKVLFAGPGMNFVLAALIFVYTFTIIGSPHPVKAAIIGDVIEGKPAYLAGLKPGDQVLSVNTVKVSTWAGFVEEVKKSRPGEPLVLKVARGRQVFHATVTPEMDESRKVPVIGVRQQIEFRKIGIWEGIKLGFLQTFQITLMLIMGLGQLLSGAASTADLAGPVGMTKMIGDAAAGGMVYLASFTAMLSINLGILNLLPIPALDGSRIIFAGIESLRGRPLEPEKENFIHFLGFVFLILLMLVVTYNDIARLVRG